MSSRKWVYIAGPFTSGGATELVKNVVNAVKTGIILRQHDETIVPIIPHLFHLADLIMPGQTYDFWLAWDFDLLERCDALLRLRGESSGADREVEFITGRGCPVFHEVGDLLEWVRQTSEEG
jgi:hypothetical protein